MVTLSPLAGFVQVEVSGVGATFDSCNVIYVVGKNWVYPPIAISTVPLGYDEEFKSSSLVSA